MRVGIVGLPNVGKSTVFNALSGTAGRAKVSNYPFCTVEPNHSVIPVPDPRLDQVARLFGQQQAAPATLELVDIAGLVRGSSHGEGLGNQFLAHIREMDALLHVVRCFRSEQVSHVEGQPSPARDAAVVDLELALADLAAVRRRLERLDPKLKGHDPEAVREAALLRRLEAALDQGIPARRFPLAKDEPALLAEVHPFGELSGSLLTIKPVLYLANLGESVGPQERLWLQELTEYAGQQSCTVLPLSGKLEEEIWELDPAEREAFSQEFGLEQRGLDRTIRACYQLLGLITFYTAVGKEARAWAIPERTPAPRAAGLIHTDMERGFIRAEVISLDLLAKAGSWEEAHRHGWVRIEGKDYRIQDGEVVHFRFSPPGRDRA